MSAKVVEGRGTSKGDVLRFSYAQLVRVVAPGTRFDGRSGAVLDYAGEGESRRWLVVLDTCEDVWLADSALVAS